MNVIKIILNHLFLRNNIRKMFVLIMVVTLLCCFEMIDSSHNYLVQYEVIVISNVNASWIISSIRKENYIFCLAACNRNQECLSTIYIESVTNNNCFLYKKHFDSTETTTLSNSKMFIKKCNNNKYLKFFTETLFLK
jgi:hypothetical protein